MKEAIKDATKLPPEALKVFFRGRTRADSDKLVLIGVKQFSKLVVIANPAWVDPNDTSSAAENRSKVDEIVDSIESIISSNGVGQGQQKLRMQELLTQKMLALDALEVVGIEREKRKKAIQRIERICDELDKT